MKELLSDNEKFARLIEALRPWLPDLVIAGGWAHRLHRLHAFAESPRHLPLMTKDVDVALEKFSGGGGRVRDALRASGFQEEMSGDAQPPVTHYRLGSPEQPFYVEFLTPLLGSGNKRDGTQAWHNVVPHLPGRWTAGIQAAIRSQFSGVNDGIRGAAVIATSVGRSLQPRSLLAACQLGLERIFS